MIRLTHNDDGKEKWQSHTVGITTFDSCRPYDAFGLDDVEGYGANFDEAFQEFLEEFDKRLVEAIKFRASLNADKLKVASVTYNGEYLGEEEFENVNKKQERDREDN